MSEIIDFKNRKVITTDLDNNYFVESSAGTGKTTILAGRIINILMSGKAKIREIAAITFTEKAAIELENKIKEFLIDAIKKGQIDYNKRDLKNKEVLYLSSALKHIDQAQISTIHSFTSRMIRERPVEARVDPNFRQLDQFEQNYFFDEKWKEWISLQMKAGNEFLRLILKEGIKVKQLKKLAGYYVKDRDIIYQSKTESPPDPDRPQVEKKAKEPTLTESVDSFLQDFLYFLEKEKDKEGVLDFNDLLIKARDMLKNQEIARKYFQNRFKYILVDEFQDTDPLQVEIVFYLAESSQKAKSWQEVKLAKGKLFIVGDPKQSIYRFRRADFSIYEKAHNLFISSGGKTETLKTNFRSGPQLIDWINDKFAKIINYEERVQPKYEEIRAYKKPEEGRAKNPDVLYAYLLEDIEEKLSADQKRNIESDFISRLIRQLVEGGGNGKALGERKRYDFSDIAVIVPK
ncbi:MAG: UvrD-helicase domain-containing protein, partial [Actinomycetia bacterium]|nr:UvrD-helicase domain-containing protein [Actinomycetes bacterium]